MDPLSFIGFLTERVMLAYAGHFDAALPLAERPIELDPQFPEGYHIKGYVLLGMKRYAEAATVLERAVELSHRGSWQLAKLGCALVALGRLDEARALLRELEGRVGEATTSSAAIATLYLHLGDHASYHRLMRRAIADRDPFALSIDREYLWAAAHDDDEFRELRTLVGLR